MQDEKGQRMTATEEREQQERLKARLEQLEGNGSPEDRYLLTPKEESAYSGKVEGLCILADWS